MKILKIYVVFVQIPLGFPDPISNRGVVPKHYTKQFSQTPAGYLRIQLNSDTTLRKPEILQVKGSVL